MGGASSYLAMLAICGFLSAAWMATKLSKMAGISSIVLEITTGVVLGPRVLGLISSEYAVCEHRTHSECNLPSDFEYRLGTGLPLGKSLGRIANMEYCDRAAYGLYSAEHSEVSGASDGHGEGSTDGTGHGGQTSGGHDVPGFVNHSTAENATGGQSDATRQDERDGELDDRGMLHGHSTTISHATAVDNIAVTTLSATTPDIETSAITTTTATILAHTTTATTHSIGVFSMTVVDDDIPEPMFLPMVGQDEDEAYVQSDRAAVADGFSHSDVSSVAGGFSPADHLHPPRRLAGGGRTFTSYGDCLAKSCEADVSLHCGLTPDVFTLIGHAGVALMIFESGMHFDFQRAQVVGPKACLVAIVGTLLPFITGTLLLVLYGYPMVPDGVAVGTSLAPTSIGIALRLLGEANVLQEDFGQAIITAAFVDDIFSLVMFNVLFSLQGDFNFVTTVVYPVVGIAFMGIAMVLAVKFWPHAINNIILPRVSKKFEGTKVTIEDEALFLIMMLLLIAYAATTHFLGTHLWGCFIAGMSFACIDKEGNQGHAHHVWVRQTKRYTSWMIRIFFACTVAFSIPVDKLLSFESFWKGSIMGIGPCVMMKVICAPFMGNAKFVIGWAMVGRAEFAYLIAQMAAAAGMIDEKTFSITIWALLYATLLAPFVFRTVLKKYIAAEGFLDADKPPVEPSEYERDAVEFHDNPGFQTKRLDNSVADTTSGKPIPEFMSPVPAAGKPAIAGGKSAAGAKVVRRRVWFGREPGQTVGGGVNNGNKGFLCCLFFKKIFLNS